MRVRIFQGAIGKYRDDLYNSMVRQAAGKEFDLVVTADRSDDLGVRSVDSVSGYTADYSLSTKLIGRGRLQFIWFRGWPSSPAGNDVVVVDGNPRMLNNYAEAMRCKRLGIPVVWWGQGFAAGSRGMAARIRIRLMRSKLFDYVLLYTEREREEYIRMGFPPERVSALNNGIDVASVNTAVAAWDPARLEAFRTKHALDGRTWVVFIGRLRARSGVELLPSLLRDLPESVGLIIVGDGPLRPQAASEFTAMGLDDRVRWAGPIYENVDIAPWMMSSACMFYPGTVGLSLIHALAYGLPVVIHDDDAAHGPEIAAHQPGVNGATFRLADGAAGAAKALAGILDDPARARAMQEAARATVRDTFNVDDMARRFLEVFETTLRRPAEPARREVAPER
jgi:glycosyltransferase involved in cell wall biosynthesis